MRSPDARKHLDNILRLARATQDTNGHTHQLTAVLRELGRALEEYDEFCFSEHRSVSVPVNSSSTGGLSVSVTTKANHFRLPLGLEES